MTDSNTRRQALKIFGSAATATFLAGCASSSAPTATSDSNDDGSSDTTGSTDTTTESPTTTESTTTTESPTTTESQTANPADWEGVSTIHIESAGTTWSGVAPEMIAGVENPTVVLYEGNEYEFIYENSDGGYHNLEIRNEGGEVVNGYSTEIMSDMGEQQTLNVEVTSDMVKYLCNPHSSSMWGEIRIE